MLKIIMMPNQMTLIGDVADDYHNNTIIRVKDALVLLEEYNHEQNKIAVNLLPLSASAKRENTEYLPCDIEMNHASCIMIEPCDAVISIYNKHTSRIVIAPSSLLKG